jgi:hypothetical protein
LVFFCAGQRPSNSPKLQALESHFWLKADRLHSLGLHPPRCT